MKKKGKAEKMNLRSRLPDRTTRSMAALRNLKAIYDECLEKPSTWKSST